jgi:hypothetical protein
MSLFDRSSAPIEEQEQPAGEAAPLTEAVEGQTEETAGPSDAEILGLTEGEDGVLSEMLGGMHGVRRYVNHRDLEYALQDCATTCERNWKDQMNRRENKGMEGKHKALVECLRDCAKKAGAYADDQEEARKSEAY